MTRFNLRALYALFTFFSLFHILCAADPVDDLLAQYRPVMNAAIANSTTCTKDKVRIRREWYTPLSLSWHNKSTHERSRGDISTAEKHNYIAAVKCLIKQPSQLNSTDY